MWILKLWSDYKTHFLADIGSSALSIICLPNLEGQMNINTNFKM